LPELLKQFTALELAMNDKEIQDKVIKGMYKIFDKLEQRISTLEKSVGRIHSILAQVNKGEDKNDA